MSTLFTFGIFGFRGILTTVAIIGGIILVVRWWLTVKNTSALFHDPKKIKATFIMLVPGLILFFGGVYYRFFYNPYRYDPYSYSGGDYSSIDSEPYVPTMARVYIANYSEKVGKIQVGDFVDSLTSKESRVIDIKSNKTSDTLRAWLGDSLVLDTIIGTGSYVGNFSDDISVVAEEVVYSANNYASTDDLEYIMLTHAGIERFSTESYEDVYGFESKAPQSMSVSSSTSRVHKWDVDLVTDEEFMKMLLDAIGKEDGESSLDALNDE